MLADELTLNTVDFASIREKLAAGAKTQRGLDRIARLAPFEHFEHVRLAHEQLSEIRRLADRYDFHVLSAVDTAPLTARAVRGANLDGRELRSIGDALTSAAHAFVGLREREGHSLDVLIAAYSVLTGLQRRVTEALDERGMVTDHASSALGRIRRDLLRAQGEARDHVAAIARSPQFSRAIQDAVVTMRNGRHVVPVKVDFSGEVPGIVHDTSASGQTVFVEPLAALEANNRVRTLQLEEEREVARILEALSREVGAAGREIEANVEMLAAVDELCAKAHLARLMRAVAPELIDAPIADIIEGRHPLLGERAVAQSLHIDADVRVIVVSGPNMGGKTVALKMFGLFVIMAHAGLQLPAESGTRIGRWTRVIADIGDRQSIADDISTFAAHLARMSEMLKDADAATLALVDEIGGGTEAGAGAALAVAFLERWLELGAAAMVTTHTTELKLFAHERPGVCNASMRFDPQTFTPTYRLDLGIPGQSLAFALASSMGIDAQIITRAQTLLDNRERSYEAALADLAQTVAVLESERENLNLERMTIAAHEGELAAERSRLRAEREAFVAHAEERLRHALREFVTELQRRTEQSRPRVTTGQSGLLDRAADAIRRDLGVVPAAPEIASDNPAFVVGARVRVHAFGGGEGEIVEDYGERVLVAMGSLRSVVEKRELEVVPTSPKGARKPTQTAQTQLAASMRVRSELDVRGMRAFDAEPLVEKWLDEASLAGVKTLRLIHGKGTGKLGRALQAMLSDQAVVATLRYGDADEGDGGVTLIELR